MSPRFAVAGFGCVLGQSVSVPNSLLALSGYIFLKNEKNDMIMEPTIFYGGNASVGLCVPEE
jgi:hypothetical protein